MSTLSELVQLGKEMGLSGGALQDFVAIQQKAQKEAQKEAREAERQAGEAEQ